MTTGVRGLYKNFSGSPVVKISVSTTVTYGQRGAIEKLRGNKECSLKSAESTTLRAVDYKVECVQRTIGG